MEYDALKRANLQIDVTYRSDTSRPGGGDAVMALLPGVQMMGGFRFGRVDKSNARLRYCALVTTGRDPNWPDHIDRQRGLVTYFGDNKKPGDKAHPRGNRRLASWFQARSGTLADRRDVPPIFLFRKNPPDEYSFVGLLVPGVAGSSQDDLVAVWRTNPDGLRFENFRATFSILDVGEISRAWLDDCADGKHLSPNTPLPWRQWVEHQRYQVLHAPPISEPRSTQRQEPADEEGRQLLGMVYTHFADSPHDFEHFAMWIWSAMWPGDLDQQATRRSSDGGRDAVGRLLIGPKGDPVHLDFALEAKCYKPGRGCGVKEVARLVSRLRHRHVGIFVTTSHVNRQAYREVREDEHPLAIVSGSDIVEVIRSEGLGHEAALRSFLESGQYILSRLS